MLSRLSRCCTYVSQPHLSKANSLLQGQIYKCKPINSSSIPSRGFRKPPKPKRPVEKYQEQGLPSANPGDTQLVPNLYKHFAFSTLVISGSFIATAIWRYENQVSETERWVEKLKRRQNSGKFFGIRDHINSTWNSLTPSQQVVSVIIGANLLVFTLLRLPTGQSLMKYCLNAPTKSNSVLSLTLTAFSHVSAVHLFCNMYVFFSFSSACMQIFGKEQFVAVYLGAGTFASLVSCTARWLRGSVTPSLGASGAILALIGAMCYCFPDSQLQIAFIGDIIPHSFSAKSAVIGLGIFDLTGLLLGWKFFDHAAHLGGLLFGLIYTAYVSQWLRPKLNDMVKEWHKLRQRKR